jgi:Phosphate transporter family
MGLGTLVGGWRIVHTVGSKITRLTPVQGSCAATAGAVMLFAAGDRRRRRSPGLCRQVERRRKYRNRLDHYVAGRGVDAAVFYALSGFVL